MTAIHHSNLPSAKREEFFTRLYKKVFPLVAAYISRGGGSFDEAKDVFHDALVIFYEKTLTTTLSDVNETAYLVGIAKHLWIKRYHENNLFTPLDNIDTSDPADQEHPSDHKILYFLEKAGHKCMELLKSFYYDQLSLTDISEKFGFSGVRSATVQKYKCLEKVRETIKEKALAYEDFME